MYPRILASTLLLLSGLFFWSCGHQATPVKQGCPPPISKRDAYKLLQEALLKGDSSIFQDGEFSGYYGDRQAIQASLDSSNDRDFLTVTGHFTGSIGCEQLALISTQFFGLSRGSNNNALLLLNDAGRIVCVANTGEIKPAKDIRDVTGDGVPEIICRSGYFWGGEMGEQYRIISLHGGCLADLYVAYSSEYWLEDMGQSYDELLSKGDTFATLVTPRLIDPDVDGRYEVRQTRTFYLYQGGRTDKEARQKAKVVRDSTTIQLK